MATVELKKYRWYCDHCEASEDIEGTLNDRPKNWRTEEEIDPTWGDTTTARIERYRKEGTILCPECALELIKKNNEIQEIRTKILKKNF